MEMGTIVSWEKKEGDKLNEGESVNVSMSNFFILKRFLLGDLLAEIETDKATMGFETPEEGYLAKILFTAGSKDIPVGKLLCIIVENEGDVAAFKDFKDDGAPAASAPAPSAPAPAAPTPVAAPPPPPAASSRPAGIQTASEQKFGDRVLASPMAKRLAEQQKLRLEGRGSGLYGSLTSKDLSDMEAAGAGAPAKGGPQAVVFPPGTAYVDIPVSNVRGVIAKRLLESKNTIPHYYLTVDCNVDEILKLRARFNKSLEKSGSKLSVNDFVIKAAAMACKKVPEVNSAWLGNVIRQWVEKPWTERTKFSVA